MLIFRLETRKGEGVYGRGYGFKYSASGLAEKDGKPCEGELTKHVGPSEDPMLCDWWQGARYKNTPLYNWKYRDRVQWFCGFDSLESLKAWFPKEGVEGMIASDIRANKPDDTMYLSVYEVSGKKVKRGEAQVMFHMPSAVFVERMALTELLEMF